MKTIWCFLAIGTLSFNTIGDLTRPKLLYGKAIGIDGLIANDTIYFSTNIGSQKKPLITDNYGNYELDLTNLKRTAAETDTLITFYEKSFKCNQIINLKGALNHFNTRTIKNDLLLKCLIFASIPLYGDFSIFEGTWKGRNSTLLFEDVNHYSIKTISDNSNYWIAERGNFKIDKTIMKLVFITRYTVDKYGVINILNKKHEATIPTKENQEIVVDTKVFKKD